MKKSAKYISGAFIIVIITTSCKINKNQETVDPDKKTEISQAPQEEKNNTPVILNEPVKINIDTEIYAKVERDALRASQNGDDSLLAFIKRTPCYGRCPIYSASFYKSGYVVYRGERFVEKQGIYTGKITEENLRSVSKMARSVNYMGFEKEYDTSVTDLPTTYTSIYLDGARKEVRNRAGGPNELRTFEVHLDKILDNISWTKKGDIGQ
ncbi:MAG TPA: hypothetical protein EYN89_03715 [Flavobacteriales bacterium]|nr:hypothetical protein [Flavobacteriales bacterium]